jgi:hypothetical protein
MAAVAGMAAAATPSMADVIVGQPPDVGTGNCYPFGCPVSEWGPDYQQIYASSDFSGTIKVTNLEFFNTEFLNGGTPDAGTYTISLSTTSTPVDGLSSTFSDNLGLNNTVVFTGSLSSLSGGVLHILLSKPFTYDPTQGNLLMDVYSADANQPGTLLFLDTNGENGGNGGIFSRGYGAGNVENNYGLVTGFSTGSAVPEPSTWAMVVLGFAGLAFAGFRDARRGGAAAA